MKTTFKETITKVHNELCDIDTKYEKYDLKYHHNIYDSREGSKREPSEYILELLNGYSHDEVIMKVFIGAFINYAFVAYNKEVLTQIMAKYPRAIKWLFMNGIIGTFGTPFDVMNDKKYMLTVTEYHKDDCEGKHRCKCGYDEDTYEYNNDDSVDFIKIGCRLNDINFIDAVKLANISNEEKCKKIATRLKIYDSDNEDILEHIKNIPGIEKLYHDGVLELCDEAFEIFDDDVLLKIIAGIA